MLVRLHKYSYTLARRNGTDHIVVGLFLISDGRVLVTFQDGGYSIPKIEIGNKTLNHAIDILAREHEIKDLKVEMWIDRVKETVDERKIHRLNFAVSGKIKRKEKHRWVSQDDLPKDMQKTLEKYWKNRYKLLQRMGLGDENE